MTAPTTEIADATLARIKAAADIFTKEVGYVTNTLTELSRNLGGEELQTVEFCIGQLKNIADLAKDVTRPL